MSILKDTAWKNSAISQKQPFTSLSESNDVIPLVWEEKVRGEKGLLVKGGTCGSQALFPIRNPRK